MVWIVGVDEAGYGPNLGPFVMTAVACRAEDALADACLWTALRPAVVDFVTLATSSDNMELSLEQVHLDDHSPLVGRTLLDAGLRQRYGVVVVGIRRRDGQMDFNPAPDSSMRAGDDLVVLGRAESLKELEAAAAG